MNLTCQETRAHTYKGQLRKDTAIAASLQKYLIFAVLACVPDRQRTIRELTVGKTLVKEDGKWLIRHGPKDYKTGWIILYSHALIFNRSFRVLSQKQKTLIGKQYGERPPLMIAEHLYPDLEVRASPALNHIPSQDPTTPCNPASDCRAGSIITEACFHPNMTSSLQGGTALLLQIQPSPKSLQAQPLD